MSLITNKKVWQKLLIIFLIIILFQAVFMKPAHAVDADILLKPITGLFVGLADALEGVMQKIVLGVDESLFEIKNGSDFWANVIVIGLFIVGAAVAIFAAIPTGGASLGVMGVLSVVGTVTTRFVIALSTYAIFGQLATTIIKDSFMDTYYLPQYELSPYEIFSDQITVLDVDFFSPKDNETSTQSVTYDAWESIDLSAQYNGRRVSPSDNGREPGGGNTLDKENGDTACEMSSQEYERFKNDYEVQTTQSGSAQADLNLAAGYTEYDWSKGQDTYKMAYMYTGLGSNSNVNVYLWKKVTRTSNNSTVLKSPAKELQPYIAGWYKTLRNLALVILLSILVYVGIRITLSSIASDKAKYKQMLMDWVVAVCLLFLMHYIMSFSIYIVKQFSSMILSIQNNSDEQRENAEQKIVGKRLGKTKLKWRYCN